MVLQDSREPIMYMVLEVIEETLTQDQTRQGLQMALWVASTNLPDWHLQAGFRTILIRISRCPIEA